MTKRRKTPDEAAAGLSLPPNIRLSREPLPGGMAYIFRHGQLGELGRMRIESTPSGETRITSEVAGFEGDPMTARRRTLLEPLTREIVRVLESLGGPGRSEHPQPTPPGPAGTVPVVEVRCERCNSLVALLIFAEDATSHARFEDYARMMFPHYSKLQIPTYIIGPVLGLDETDVHAEILKVWPEREPIATLAPDEFNPRLD